METVASEPTRVTKALEIIRAPRIDNNGLALDFYNWSNDHYYPPQKAQKVTIRQTGLIEIIHAGPAVKLQLPFVSACSGTKRSRTVLILPRRLSTNRPLQRLRSGHEIDRCYSSPPGYLYTLTSSCHRLIGPSSKGKRSRPWKGKGRRWNPRSLRARKICRWRIECLMCCWNIR